MSVKVSNPRLELNIKPFENPNYLATFSNETTLDYVPLETAITTSNLRDYNNGLSLSFHGHNIIISAGSFFDEETKTLYKFDKPHSLYVMFENDGGSVEAEESTTVVFESDVAGDHSISLEAGTYKVTATGAGGPAAMKGVYDDRGYLWTGGGGAAFIGTFNLTGGVYTITVGKIVNNTTAQTSNTQTSNPTDTTIYNTVISNVVTVGSGGPALADNYVGAGGVAPTLSATPLTTILNQAGNSGVSGSGGKGSSANYTANGGASLYKGYGIGQGGSVSEYASKRYWIDGTGGYVKIEKINDALIDNLDYKVYYNFVTNEFMYSSDEPTDRCHLIGTFRADTATITHIYPQQDLYDDFSNHFIIAESLGTNGYRVYSDGWKEQWGNGENPTFPIAFENPPLIATVGATSVTNTGMTIAAGFWQAEGY